MSLEGMIQACLQRDGSGEGLSTVVALHLAQMKEWGVRGGNLEFRPVQDDPKGNRVKFIERQHSRNRLRSRLNYVMDCFVARGEICWLFLPDPTSPGDYLIDFFVGGLNNPNPEFKEYYKPGGRELEKIIIVYSYDQESPMFGANTKRWVTITVTQDWISQSEGSTKLSFSQLASSSHSNSNSYGAYGGAASQQRYPNPFAPNLPVRIAKNNARRQGQQGSDDFYWIKNLIEDHEELVTKAHRNLKRFSNPSLVTTRSAHEVLESNRGNIPQTWASANRYVDFTGDMMSGSTNPADSPTWGMARTPTGFLAGGSTSTSDGNIADIIGGVGEGERFGYIQADAVSGDQNLWIRQIRELIHWCLGGVDPLGMSSGATFGEVRTLFGRVQNTANLKAQALYKEGLCEVYEQLIWAEEERFRKWLFTTLKQLYPEPFQGLTHPSQLTDQKCQDIAELAKQGVIQLPQPEGLLPYGDRTVAWRHTAEVFQLTTREELDRSIAARNEREDGLSQEWVLRKQYPNMTDQEIRNAMSGFSPRVVQSANGAIGSLLQLFQQFMSLPDPDPEVRSQLPKGVDPPPWGLRLGIPQLVEQAMLTLRKEISYGKPTYEEADEPEPDDQSLAAIAASLGVALNGQRATVLSPTRESSLSTYGLPPSVLPLLAADAAARPVGAISQNGQVAGLHQGQRSSLFPAPGATVATATGEPIRDTRSGERGSIYATNPGGFRPPIPGNGVDPTVWYLYSDQLAALAAGMGANPTAGQQQP